MPEVQTSRFSRRTRLAAIDVLANLTHAEFGRYIRGLGEDFGCLVPGPDASKRERLNGLIDLVDKDPDRLIEGQTLSEKLVEKAASFFPSKPRHPWEKEVRLTPQLETFQRLLSLDGFTVEHGAIRRSLPADVGLPGVQDTVEHLLGKHCFTTAKGHLDQARDAHGRGDWAAANGQIRSFLDAMLDEMAERIDPSATAVESGHLKCTKLAAAGFLSRDLNEWDDGGKGFINGLRKRLHPHGSHPGLSDDEDSTFRLHTVLITARLLLVRFDKRPLP